MAAKEFYEENEGRVDGTIAWMETYGSYMFNKAKVDDNAIVEDLRQQIKELEAKFNRERADKYLLGGLHNEQKEQIKELKNYTRHDQNCPAWYRKECTCGLSKLLNSK